MKTLGISFALAVTLILVMQGALHAASQEAALTTDIIHDGGVTFTSRETAPKNYISVPVEDVTIEGPTTGAVNASYTFTATVSPISATLPVTYAWQVTLVIPTTSGEDYEKSPFYVFRIVDPSALMELQAGQAAAEEVLRLLRALIGDEADEIANALTDFMLAEIRHEGSEIELNELYRLISSYQGKPFQVNYIDLSSSQ